MVKSCTASMWVVENYGEVFALHSLYPRKVFLRSNSFLREVSIISINRSHSQGCKFHEMSNNNDLHVNYSGTLMTNGKKYCIDQKHMKSKATTPQK